MKKILLIVFILPFFSSCTKKEIRKKENLTALDFSKADAFYEKNKYDSAYFYYNKIASANTDSLSSGKALLSMSIIQSIKGDYFGSYETAIKSIHFFNKKKPQNLAAVYNTIAINNNDLKQYEEAIVWYKKSLSISPNSEEHLMWKNNLAVAFYKCQKFEEAKKIYQDLLKNDTVLKDTALLAKVTDNFAYAKWLQNPSYNANTSLLKALSLREKRNDFWGQNASFAHLSNYYQKVQPDSALFYAHKMYLIAQRLNSPEDRLEALQKLIKLSPLSAAKDYFERYDQLGDSLQTTRNAAKNQFALIRYETEKNKADNLKLQKDNSDKKYRIIIQQILLWVFIGISVLAVIWYRKRKKRLEAAAQNAIQENQLRTSKKVHDVVANGLYRVMTEIENQNDLDKEYILDKIDSLYEKSRDISYDPPAHTNENFQDKVSGLLKSFATENTKIVLAGNSAALWKKVGPEVKYEIEHILQELMVNMKKHSGASKVAIRFERSAQLVNIYYTDNGVGIPEEIRFNNGLRNTGNRIDTIQGTITFDTKVEKGLKILISFPVS